ncbi:helix-turn-helix domain-containing protein [Paenarthrobacter sp. NPDC091669]|uniref:helix-turn-helix domain-containing protein n=1 Tax=Paenarthrobacter sp. NPDC091669 TaxID=3364384 RepID=UPI0037F49020
MTFSGTRIQSVSRAARLLLAVASNDDGLTVEEVASRFDLSTPTSYHLPEHPGA